jgi:hypothetical protein
MIFKLILLGFIIWLGYRFLARFVLPVFQLAKMTSAKMREMEQKMTGQSHPVNPGTRSKPKARDTDYIDYEEVK